MPSDRSVYFQAYYKAHRKYYRAYSDRWWKAHPEKLRAKWNRKYWKNPTKYRLKRRIYRAANLKKCRKDNLDWQRKNSSHRREYMARYYQTHKERWKQYAKI